MLSDILLFITASPANEGAGDDKQSTCPITDPCGHWELLGAVLKQSCTQLLHDFFHYIMFASSF